MRRFRGLIASASLKLVGLAVLFHALGGFRGLIASASLKQTGRGLVVSAPGMDSEA